MPELALIPLEAVADGKPLEVVAEGRIFAVFREGDHISVLDGLCAHAGGSLGKGTVSNSVVTCPWHGWQYNVRTGEHCLTPRICQTVYPSRVIDGMIVIEL